MFTSITSHGGALVTAIVVLTGGAILCGGAAAADPNQDEQFLALLNQEEIPALQNVPSLIATAHNVCRKLDGGMPVDALVDDMRNNSFTDPNGAQFPARRITSTITRFITAAVEAYCPADQSKIASIMANPAPGSNEPMHRVAACTHNAVDSGCGVVRLPHLRDGGVFVASRYGDDRSDCDAHGTVLVSLIGAVPSGEITPPDPPQIPAPPPPTAQILPKQAPPPPKQAPPAPKQVPPPPKQSPPPPQQSPPPPQQAEPPAVAPQPGGAAGSGGNGGGGSGGNGGGGAGGNGGDRPAEPSPTPPMPPGWVRLAP
jgi:hypothetical protein